MKSCKIVISALIMSLATGSFAMQRGRCNGNNCQRPAARTAGARNPHAVIVHPRVVAPTPVRSNVQSAAVPLRAPVIGNDQRVVGIRNANPQTPMYYKVIADFQDATPWIVISNANPSIIHFNHDLTLIIATQNNADDLIYVDNQVVRVLRFTAEDQTLQGKTILLNVYPVSCGNGRFAAVVQPEGLDRTPMVAIYRNMGINASSQTNITPAQIADHIRTSEDQIEVKKEEKSATKGKSASQKDLNFPVISSETNEPAHNEYPASSTADNAPVQEETIDPFEGMDPAEVQEILDSMPAQEPTQVQPQPTSSAPRLPDVIVAAETAPTAPVLPAAQEPAARADMPGTMSEEEALMTMSDADIDRLYPIASVQPRPAINPEIRPAAPAPLPMPGQPGQLAPHAPAATRPAAPAPLPMPGQPGQLAPHAPAATQPAAPQAAAPAPATGDDSFQDVNESALANPLTQVGEGEFRDEGAQ